MTSATMDFQYQKILRHDPKESRLLSRFQCVLKPGIISLTHRLRAVAILFSIIQSDRKVTQPILDTCCVCQKINYIETRKQKTMSYYVLEMSTAFSDASIHSFPHILCFPVKSFCVTETVHQTRYCRYVWHRRIWKCIPKLILAS
jgi:hypothetical protein